MQTTINAFFLPFCNNMPIVSAQKWKFEWLVSLKVWNRATVMTFLYKNYANQLIFIVGSNDLAAYKLDQDINLI